MTILNEINDQLSNEIDDLNAFLKKVTTTEIPLINTLSSHMIDSGGKRIRPIIVFLILTFEPIMQFLPIFTFCSITVLTPKVVLDPILTPFPMKLFLPNVTEGNFEERFFVSLNVSSG